MLKIGHRLAKLLVTCIVATLSADSHRRPFLRHAVYCCVMVVLCTVYSSTGEAVFPHRTVLFGRLFYYSAVVRRHLPQPQLARSVSFFSGVWLRASCDESTSAVGTGNFKGGGASRPIVNYRDTLRSAVQKRVEPIELPFGFSAWMCQLRIMY